MAAYQEYWYRPTSRRGNYIAWRSQNEDDRCNNCFRLGACIIPYPEGEGVLFTKTCYACGYEEECNGVGGELPVKTKATQTELTGQKIKWLEEQVGEPYKWGQKTEEQKWEENNLWENHRWLGQHEAPKQVIKKEAQKQNGKQKVAKPQGEGAPWW